MGRVQKENDGENWIGASGENHRYKNKSDLQDHIMSRSATLNEW